MDWGPPLKALSYIASLDDGPQEGQTLAKKGKRNAANVQYITRRFKVTGGLLKVARRAACQYPAGALLEPQALACEFDMSESERRRRAARALGLGRGWREELVSVYAALASAMFVWADGWLRSATFVQRMTCKRSLPRGAENTSASGVRTKKQGRMSSGGAEKSSAGGRDGVDSPP